MDLDHDLDADSFCTCELCERGRARARAREHDWIARAHRGRREPVPLCGCTSCESARTARIVAHRADNRPAVLVEREVACPTCRRVFCRARVTEGATVEVVCAGCIEEGRT